MKVQNQVKVIGVIIILLLSLSLFDFGNDMAQIAVTGAAVTQSSGNDVAPINLKIYPADNSSMPAGIGQKVMSSVTIKNFGESTVRTAVEVDYGDDSALDTIEEIILGPGESKDVIVGSNVYLLAGSYQANAKIFVSNTKIDIDDTIKKTISIVNVRDGTCPSEGFGQEENSLTKYNVKSKPYTVVVHSVDNLGATVTVNNEKLAYLQANRLATLTDGAFLHMKLPTSQQLTSKKLARFCITTNRNDPGLSFKLDSDRAFLTREFVKGGEDGWNAIPIGQHMVGKSLRDMALRGPSENQCKTKISTKSNNPIPGWIFDNSDKEFRFIRDVENKLDPGFGAPELIGQTDVGNILWINVADDCILGCGSSSCMR